MKSLVKSNNMDLSLKPSTSAGAASSAAAICSLPLNSHNNNMEKETKFTSTLNNYPSGTTVEEVTCMVGKKLRHLGLVYMNANGVTFEYVAANNIRYKPGDSAYLESSCRRDQFEPFNICTIQEFFRHKRDGCLYVRVKGFYRLSDLRIPEGEYQRYIVQDRSSINNSGGQEGLSSQIQSRELVAADGVCDSYPVSALRGLSEVRHFRDINAAKEFVAKSDTFFYIFGYNSKSGLAPPQGEIRVGPKHQARLPECQPDLSPAQMPERCPEECMWRPKEVAYDLNMYISAARSVFAHRFCLYTHSYPDSDVTSVNNINKDEARQKAFDLLYKHNYNMEAALHAVIMTQQQENAKWSEEDTKNFVKGVRKWDKNFFRIRKELLPHHTTAELIEFYYLWKKTPSGNKLMKSVRKPANRRSTNLMRRMRGRPNRTTLSSDFVDLNPSSDEDRESEESDKDLSTYQCTNCNATESKDWHPTTNKSAILCNDCRLFFKKYGELRPTEDRENNTSFNVKSAPEEEGNENINTSNGNGKNGPTTRRTNNTAGRSKSGNTSPDTAAAAEKAQRSPGTASVSSGGSAETKQTKKGRGKGTKAVRVEEAKVSTVLEVTAPIVGSSNSRKRRKISASDKQNAATDKCDVPKESIPGDTDASESKPDLVTSIKSPSNSVPFLLSPASNVPTSPPGKASVKLEDVQVKSPGLVKSPKNVVGIDVPLALIKTEPGVKPPIGVVYPLQASQAAGKPVMPMPKLDRHEIKTEKMDKNERNERERLKEETVVKVESDADVQEILREPLSPIEQASNAEPKPDHAEIQSLRENENPGTSFGKIIRVWNRGDNSCARTDHIFAPSLTSPMMVKREKQPKAGPSQIAASASKMTIKSPIPVKEEKRTPASSQAPNIERERDNRSTVPAGQPGLPMPTARIADTPPRMNLPPRHPGLSPHGPEVMMHPGMNPFGPMSPNMYNDQQLLRFHPMDRERILRSGSVPPGMQLGHNPSSLEHMMELQRRMQGGAPAAGSMHPFMHLYPNLTPQAALSLMNEQQQREAFMERSMMMPPPNSNQGAMHQVMHGLHPDMGGPTPEQQLSMYLAAASGNPFARPPYMAQHPGMPGMSGPDAATLHALGRTNIFEQEAAYMAAQAQAMHQLQAQQSAMRQMEEHNAVARMQQIMMQQNSNPHDFMSRMGGG